MPQNVIASGRPETASGHSVPPEASTEVNTTPSGFPTIAPISGSTIRRGVRLPKRNGTSYHTENVPTPVAPSRLLDQLLNKGLAFPPLIRQTLVDQWSSIGPYIITAQPLAATVEGAPCWLNGAAHSLVLTVDPEDVPQVWAVVLRWPIWTLECSYEALGPATVKLSWEFYPGPEIEPDLDLSPNYEDEEAG